MLAMEADGRADEGADLGRARLAIAAAFLTQGLVFISLTTRLPRIQDRGILRHTVFHDWLLLPPF
jgi:hypothetical protein